MACGTLAALGLTAAGTGMNEVANSNIRGKMNSLVGQEVNRNKQFENQAQGFLNSSINNSTPTSAQNQIGQGQQQLAGLIQGANAVPITTSLPSLGAVNSNDQQARNNISNQDAANYGGISNYGLQQGLSNLRTNSNLGLIGNQAQQWANILPPQLQQAQQSQGGLQALGSLFDTAGSLAGLSGLYSGFAPASQGGQFSNMLGQVASNGQMSYDPLIGNWFQLQ